MGEAAPAGSRGMGFVVEIATKREECDLCERSIKEGSAVYRGPSGLLYCGTCGASGPGAE